MYKIKEMTDDYAAIINTWKYDYPYEEYSFDGDAEDLEQILCGYYFAVLNKKDDVVGFVAIGPAAQKLSSDNEHIFEDESYTDIAFGLKPELTGKGYGRKFIAACIKWAKKLFPEDGIRISVMNNNIRALKIYLKLGFKEIYSNESFSIMTIKEFKRYTLGEEIFNAVSHGIGALLSIAALVLLIIAAVIWQGTVTAVISAVIYGVSLIILYMASTLYHAIANPKAKKVFRILDHSSIFLLITGTYTPITLVTLGNTSLGYIMFGALWGLTVLGIILNSISIEKFKILSMVLYVCMGWVAVFTFKPLIEKVDVIGLALIIIGGVAYTGGLLFYGMKKYKYMHSVWHLFVLAGSIFQFFGVILHVYG